jgi:hypothetical protein
LRVRGLFADIGCNSLPELMMLDCSKSASKKYRIEKQLEIKCFAAQLRDEGQRQTGHLEDAG